MLQGWPWSHSLCCRFVRVHELIEQRVDDRPGLLHLNEIAALESFGFAFGGHDRVAFPFDDGGRCGDRRVGHLA